MTSDRVTAAGTRAVLTPAQIAATADSMVAQQLKDGRLPWHAGDVEPHGALDVVPRVGLVAGRHAEAEKAYEWLVASQRPDGSWASYYHYGGSVKDPNTDANICAYVAVGVWHHYLVTGDIGFLHDLWPVVERAIDMVLDLQ
ncbi:MAG TPA: prenyltransferase, partial [Acidimicrobiia bacterium]|nr:prenyltransferase [Acidimicrobiia bacterium]